MQHSFLADSDNEFTKPNKTHQHEVTDAEIWRPISQEFGYTIQL
jgi:hypothetical protein